MRSLLLIAVSGLFSAVSERGEAFMSHPLIVRQSVKHQSSGRQGFAIANVASSSRQGPSSEQPPQQRASLTDLASSWFKLPPPNTSKTNKSLEKTATDDVRATIRELRDSNDELRAEVLALRTYMLQRGFTPVEDIFADPSSRKPAVLPSPTTSSSPPPATTTATDTFPSQPTPIMPPPPPRTRALPREARLAGLALLWAAAISVGGVFVPIAIREGAEHSLRWLDGGGSLIPAPLKRVLSGYRGRWRGRGWGDAVLSYVPILARAPKGAGEGEGGEKEEEALQGERLVGAWDELKPRKRMRENRP